MLYRVPDETLKALEEISEGLGLEELKDRRAALGFPITGHDDETFHLFNLADEDHPTFEAGDEFGIEQRARKTDVEAVRERIRDANGRQTGPSSLSMLTREPMDGQTITRSRCSSNRSPGRASTLYEDAVVGHRPHILREIEVYEREPIFYSLGNFLMQNKTVEFVLMEMYERCVLDEEAVPADVFDEAGGRTRFLGDSVSCESVFHVCEFDTAIGDLGV